MRSLPAAALGLFLLLSGPARAGAPDWAAVQEAGTVEVATLDEDGETRETTVWVVVLDGTGYVRTGSSRWGENTVRSRELVLRLDGQGYPMRVDFVEDDVARQRIADAFRAKYGVSDWLVSWMRGERPKIMQLAPRE